jgi:large subunit ribosomal protein L5
MSRLKKLYKEQVIPKMKKKFDYNNDLSVPKIEKVVVNVGTGVALKDSKLLDSMIESVKKICGQAPIKTYARKAISGFGVKEKQAVGLKVTLRRERMYDFLDKLVGATLPRVRDFRGLSVKGFDKQGNFTIGFKEHIVFPEVKADEVEKIHGLEVCISTTAKASKEALELFKLLGFPLKEK